MTQRGRMLVVILVVQVLVIIGLATGRELTLRSDQDVILQTVPVDPRDMFRGDYVVLAYEISVIESSRVDRLNLEPGDTVFVGLVQSGDNWVASRVERQPFEEVDGMIRGTVVGAGTETARVEYGIEQYFVPEGSGRVVEESRDVDVVVALDDDGGAVIRHLIVDGEVWDPYA